MKTTIIVANWIKMLFSIVEWNEKRKKNRQKNAFFPSLEKKVVDHHFTLICKLQIDYLYNHCL